MIEGSVYTYLPKLISNIVSQPMTYKAYAGPMRDDYLDLLNTEYLRSLFRTNVDEYYVSSCDVSTTLDNTWKKKIHRIVNLVGVDLKIPYDHEWCTMAKGQIFMLLPNFSTKDGYDLVIMGNPILECLVMLSNSSKSDPKATEIFNVNILNSLQDLYLELVDLSLLTIVSRSCYFDDVTIRGIIISSLVISTLKQTIRNLNDNLGLVSISANELIPYVPPLIPSAPKESTFGDKKCYDSIRHLSDYFSALANNAVQSASYTKFLTDVFNIIYEQPKELDT